MHVRPFLEGATSSAHEPVPSAVHGAEVDRVRRILLQFLAQPQDVVVHRPCARVILISQTLFSNSSRDSTRSAFWIMNFRTFNSCAVRATSFCSRPHLHAGEVDLHVAEEVDVRDRDPRRTGAAPCAPEPAALAAEGLGNVIMGTQFEQKHLVHHIRCARSE